ncbi:hypothetical protein AQJ67_38670 [Streptomyces caeruleatus]|uniref:Novel STAND NTPase 1 domain-containing protein n=1 Tax=Streptomyces caeruleatus TaxID=661399 RepID=A0A124I6N6_9ACTN|nr:hypothetical protein AQJ67_38670 [Streptomyces caeruleatus]
MLGSDDTVVGAGFLLAEDLLATCAHVVLQAGAGPGEELTVVFPHADGKPRLTGRVLSEAWRAREAEDIAVVRFDGPVGDVPVLPLGFSEGCRGHKVRSFGFPRQAPPGGHFGTGVAGAVLDHDASGPVLQLSDANDLTTGFSGGPVVDDFTEHVVGMVTSIVVPDEHDRGQNIAYATAVQALRKAWPELGHSPECPYPGLLEPYGREHAAWFHGRERAVSLVLAALAEQTGRGSGVLLLGPSGSGKSSLVRAGVLPALEDVGVPGSDRWLPVVVRPGSDLMAELDAGPLPGTREHGLAGAVGSRLDDDPDHDRILLVVDQFEELLFGDPAVVEPLTEAIGTVPRLTVLLVLRDDFYPRLAASAPALLEKLRHGLVNMPATLDRKELEAIVTRPAAAVGARFEYGLPELIVAALLTDSTAPVTLLPALQLAMNRLWERLDPTGCLTYKAHHDIGRVTGALGMWCQDAVEKLPPDQRPVAEKLLTALVRPADDERQVPAVRQRVPLDVLREMEADADEVLAELIRSRIVIIGMRRRPGRPDDEEPVAELIHDVLIRAWPALNDWVARDHRFHDWLRRADERRVQWDELHHPDDLLHGSDLADGLRWAARERLPRHTAEYVQASEAHHKAREAHRKARQQRARRLNVILAVLLGLVLVAASVAFHQRQQALEAKQLAESRQLLTQSRTLLSQPELAALLAVQAYRTWPTPESRAALYAASDLPLVRRLEGAGGPMALSRDGRTLATASGKDGDEVRLWNLVSRAQRTLRIGAGREDAAHDGSGYRATAVAFDDSGGTLAVGEADRVRLLDVRDGHQKLSITLGSGASPREIRFTADDTLTTVDGDGLAVTWSLKTRKPLDRVSATVPGKRPPTDDLVLTVTPDGRKVAASSPGRGVVVLDRTTGRKRTIADQHDDPVRSVALTEDGDTLATGGESGRIRLIDVRTGKVTATLRGPSATVRALAFAPAGDTLAALTDDRAVKLWDVPHRRLRTSFASGHARSDHYRVAFRPDGRTVVTSDYSEVRVWNLDQLQPYARVKRSGQLGGPALGLAFSPDGADLLGVGTKEAQVWDAGTGDVRVSYSGTHALRATAAYDREGRPLTVVDDEDGWAVRDIATRKALPARGPGTSEQRGVREAALSPDGSTVALRRGNDLSVRDTATGVLRSSPRLGEGDRQFDSLLLSRNGTTLAARNSGTVVVWDTATGDLRTSLEAPDGTAPIKPLAFSEDGSVLVTGGDGPLRLWDTVSGRLDATLEGSDGVTAAAYSPDGRFLATGGRSGSVRLWETATNRSRRVLTGAPGPVASVAFAPDGGRLAVGSEDAGVELWRLSLPDPEEAVERICWAVGRDFTQKERAEYLPDPGSPPPCT